ncbi:RNA polymerase recycling motor ATPase HelR [Plantactinospora siamensis]|uniref:RNA polymerase recycling motor ATPase HelR n=1 Tax=Plantactinospora siamensis TaxID=555372 RepID=A0ABV6NZU4_9ACTN
MKPLTTSAFDLPDRLAHKADPTLIAADDRHFAAVAESIERSVADLSDRLDAERRSPAGKGRQAVERDQAVRRLAARLRAMRRFGIDLCLGRMVAADDPEPVYVGRLGLTDGTGRQLLVDWRSPAAEPFFGATHANPMGLMSRRRYRWTRGRIGDYWDEVFTPDGLAGHAALDDQSAFIASLGGSRSARMRDVLGTIQADQDAIIRAGSRGALVVDGGPGTGKTVVALHRTAYLLYSDPRLGHRRGGVLFVGPHQPYLAYVADVLPSLGEEDVQICTLRDLVPEGPAAAEETDPEVARLKSSAELVGAVEAAVRFYEDPPATGMTVDVGGSDLRLGADDWAEAFGAVTGIPHNEARDEILDELVSILLDRYDGDEPTEEVREALRRNGELRTALHRAWPMLDPADIVADLWSVPAYLRRCAPWLAADDVRRLQRPDARAWTVADLPLLDAARLRLGDPEVSGRERRRATGVALERDRRAAVVDELIEAHTYDDGEGVLASLRQLDLQDALIDEAGLPDAEPDRLAGPFAHIVVDEAQELTDAQWQMLLLRCPSRSFTIVGDRAQARHGFTESWRERLGRIGLDRIELASLSINYRTPTEVMAEAEPVIRAVLPDANVPTSIRGGGRPVVRGRVAEMDGIVAGWLAAHAEGTACVIAAASAGPGSFAPSGAGPTSFARSGAGAASFARSGAGAASFARSGAGAASFAGSDSGAAARDGSGSASRVRWLTPELAKGLEFDLVVLVDPEAFGAGISGAVDRYVAMTRATQQLVILTSR